MQDETGPGMFLERRSYRRRRLLDGLRLLPFLGAWLFMLPALWPVGVTTQAPPMSRALIYVFGAWFILIVICALLQWAIERYVRDAPEDASAPGASDADGHGDPR